eukprot:351308-Prorocentrum_minimum.AAC.1
MRKRKDQDYELVNVCKTANKTTARADFWFLPLSCTYVPSQGDAYTAMVCAGNFEGAMQVWGVARSRAGGYYMEWEYYTARPTAHSTAVEE